MSTHTLSAADFEYLSGLLKQRSGLALSSDKGYLIETRLQPVARAHGLTSVAALVAQMRANPHAPMVYQVVESMTTNESMFFRDTRPFDQFKTIILPALKAAGKNHIRIWSSACSTGQEPYSLAMLLKEEAVHYPKLTAEIYATDLAEKVLERGRSGLYTQFEVQRGLPIAMLMKYFVQRPNNMWEIDDSLKSMVTFASNNLLRQFVGMGTFDVIFCRNVLIYFDAKTKTDVLNRLSTVMNSPGYLSLGAAEAVHGHTTKFKPLENVRGLFTLA